MIRTISGDRQKFIEIIEFCVGNYWRGLSYESIIDRINKKLNINLDYSDSELTFDILHSAYLSHKRNLKIEEILD